MNKTKAYAAVVVLLCTFQPLYGATRTWTGGGSTSKWSDAANWGGTAPVPGDDLVFPSGVAFGDLINDYPAGTGFHSITAGAVFLTLSGNAISLGSGGFTSTASNAVFVHLPISLSASQTWAATSAVFINSPVAVNANTVTFGGPNVFSFSADVSGGGAIIVAGGGVGIDAATTFSGQVTISGGSISVFQGSLTAPILVTAGALAFSSNGTVGSVDVRAGGTIAPGNGSSGPNSTVGNSGDVRLAAGARYVEVITSADPSTGFGNLHVTGSVNLGGATLELIASGLSPGTHLVLIDNDGTDPIIGTFAGLPEGAIIADSSGTYRISYVAGTGNDVGLTALIPTTTTVSASPSPSFVNQMVTLTATVTATGHVPSGRVTFFAGTTALGTVPLGPDGVATLGVFSFAAGSPVISAQYSGDAVLSPSTSSTVRLTVNTLPPAPVPALSWWALAALGCALALAGLFVRR